MADIAIGQEQVLESAQSTVSKRTLVQTRKGSSQNHMKKFRDIMTILSHSNRTNRTAYLF